MTLTSCSHTQSQRSNSVAASKTMKREITPVILSVSGQSLTAPQLVSHPTEQGQENSDGSGLWIWSIQGKGSLCLHCHSVCFTNEQVIVTDWKLSPFLHLLSKLRNLLKAHYMEFHIIVPLSNFWNNEWHLCSIVMESRFKLKE